MSYNPTIFFKVVSWPGFSHSTPTFPALLAPGEFCSLHGTLTSLRSKLFTTLSQEAASSHFQIPFPSQLYMISMASQNYSLLLVTYYTCNLRIIFISFPIGFSVTALTSKICKDTWHCCSDSLVVIHYLPSTTMASVVRCGPNSISTSRCGPLAKCRWNQNTETVCYIK